MAEGDGVKSQGGSMVTMSQVRMCFLSEAPLWRCCTSVRKLPTPRCRKLGHNRRTLRAGSVIS